MKTQMLRVYEATREMPMYCCCRTALILSSTPWPLLHDFAARLDVTSNRWHFVTESRLCYKIAQTSYYATALEDKTEPDGFIHSRCISAAD